ncbi:MAG: RNA polymerase sigma factor [Chloroflexota bacterium]
MTDLEERRAAVDRAYRDHADDMYRVAFAILHDREAAVDATHECFVRAFDRWEQYDDHRPIRAWLHGIVSHAALDDLRKRRVRRLAASVIGRLAEPGTPDPSAEVAMRELIETGLAGLEPRARAALVLRHYYGYEYAEIAEYLGTSAGNVGSILSRSHATLRGRLAAASDLTEPPASRRVAR